VHPLVVNLLRLIWYGLICTVYLMAGAQYSSVNRHRNNTTTDNKVHHGMMYDTDNKQQHVVRHADSCQTALGKSVSSVLSTIVQCAVDSHCLLVCIVGRVVKKINV
jgi:hypothetical protein